MRILFSVALVLMSHLHALAQHNFIAIDPILPLFGTVQVQYERAICGRLSGVMAVGIKSSSGVFELNGIETESINLDDVDFQGFKVLPEVRWYLQKGSGLTGFYSGVYYRYQDYGSHVTGQYTANDGSNVKVDLDLQINSNTGGLELGYKLKVVKGLFIDMIFLGLGMTSHHVVISENTVLPDKFYQRFSDAAERFSVLKELAPKLDFTKEDLNTRFLAPSFRYGLKIGWSF